MSLSSCKQVVQRESSNNKESTKKHNYTDFLYKIVESIDENLIMDEINFSYFVLLNIYMSCSKFMILNFILIINPLLSNE